MIVETPLIQELLNERSRDEVQAAVLEVLRTRIGVIPDEVAVRVRTIQDVPQLRQLLVRAAGCSDLDAFRTQLPT